MVWAGSRLGTLSCQRQLPEIRFRTRKPYWQTNGVAGWRNHCVIEAIAIHPFHVTSSPRKKNDSIVLSIVFCSNRCSTLIWSETLPILYHIISYYNNIYIIEYIYILLLYLLLINGQLKHHPPHFGVMPGAAGPGAPALERRRPERRGVSEDRGGAVPRRGSTALKNGEFMGFKGNSRGISCSRRRFKQKCDLMVS